MDGLRRLAVCPGSLLLFVLTVSGTMAQDATEAAKQPPPRAIALIDLPYIFEHFPRFQERLAELRGKVEKAEAEVNEKKEAIETMVKQLQIHTLGTPEYTAMEKKINVAKAELTGEIESRKAGFLREEALFYHTVYEEIFDELEAHAKEHDIAVVLRFHDQPVNVRNPQQVLQKINRPVVWYDKSLDLTRTILQRLIEKSEAAEDEDDADETLVPSDAEKPKEGPGREPVGRLGGDQPSHGPLLSSVPGE